MFELSPTSPGRIFEIRPDHARLPDQWFLNEPRTAAGEEIDAREFTEGIPYRGPLPAVVPIRNPGREVSFHLGAFDMPIVSQAIATTIAKVASSDSECFPVKVPGSKGRYSILNVVCLLDCLDEERSEFTRWEASDGRPDRTGQYHMISTIRVNLDRTQNHHIFRIKTWPLALLVSETIKEMLHQIPNLGVVFEPAS